MTRPPSTERRTDWARRYMGQPGLWCFALAVPFTDLHRQHLLPAWLALSALGGGVTGCAGYLVVAALRILRRR